MKINRLFACGFVVTGVLSCAFPSAAQTVNEFASRASVAVPAGASIVRVALPAASLASMQSRDAADLRVFNATGAMLPYALINAATQTPQSTETVGAKIAALPIYATESTSANTPTLRIEEGPKRRIIEYTGASNATTTTREARGLLFDTRAIEGDVRAVDFNGTLLVGSIVKLSLDASTDLKTWRNLANDAPVFDFGSNAPSNRRVTLASAQSLKNHYLRLTWSTPNALAFDALQPVSASAAPAAAPLRVELGAPTSANDEAVEWTLASGMRASALHLQTTAPNALMPVRVLTRARAGDPWRLVMSTVVYRLNTAGSNTSNTNPSTSLFAPLDAHVRIEPHTGYRLSGVPLTLALEYPPLHAVFVASGNGPFVVAAGKAGLASAALPISTVMPGYSGGAEYALPVLQATADAAASSGAATGASAAMASWLNKSTLLWSVLGLAVVVLGALAVSLLRSPVKK